MQFRAHIPYSTKGMFDKKRPLTKRASLMNTEASMKEIDQLVSGDA